MTQTKRMDNRISQVTTQWTEIFAAHGLAENEQLISAAQQNVLCKYSSCVYRYLMGATRCADAAEELAQEFAFRFVRGDLGKAEPTKGRFRDYLRMVLRNLVNDHFRRAAKPSHEKMLDIAEHIRQHSVDPFDELEERFAREWRDKMIESTWTVLAEDSSRRDNYFYTVLRFRAEHPHLNSMKIAERLSERLQKPLTADWVRQKIHRARQRFSELLIAEVKKTIRPADDRQQLLDELAELKLLEYIYPQRSTVR